MEEFMLPCLNKQLFGMDCYGCGAQRSLSLLMKGEFVAAFHMFPAIYTIILLLGITITNLFLSFKNDYTIKMALVFINVGVITINYFVKLYHLFIH